MQVIGSGGDYVAGWVAERVGYGFDSPFEAIGIYDEEESIVGGAVFFNYRKTSVEIAFAADSPKAVTKKVIKSVIGYPFAQLGCNRITAFARVDNAKSRRLLEGVGFVHEGVMRQVDKDRNDYVMYGLLDIEFKEKY